MNCCICGCSIEQWGNNPFPLCNENDYESRCCDSCNMMVVKARIMQSGQKEEKIEVGDDIVIFYAKNSDSPTKLIGEQGKFLAGTVTSIIQKGNLISYEGTWGSFKVDIRTDQFMKV